MGTRIGAAESPQVKRAREKVKAHLDAGDKEITDQALKKTKEVIHKWLNRHESERVPLKTKEIKLFDTNQHPEKVHSSYVRLLEKKLAKSPASSLKGRRITTG